MKHVIKMLIKHERKSSALLHWGNMPCPLYILLSMLTRCLSGPLDLSSSILILMLYGLVATPKLMEPLEIYM